MTNAIKQACEYVFENTDIIRIFAEPFAHNQASCSALEKSFLDVKVFLVVFLVFRNSLS